MVCIVGIDGSDGSRVALRWGCDFAAAMADRLCVVRAWEYPSTSVLPGAAPLRGADEVDDVVAAGVTEFVRDVLGVDAEHAEVLVERGPADFALLHAARRLRPAALVVGKRGLGAVTARLLGSVSRRLAEHAPCPVIIVPPEPAGTAGPIVIGVDGSVNGAAAMRWAVNVAQATGASITVVHGFNSPRTELAGPVIEQLRLHGQAVVDGQCHAVAAAGIECRAVVDMIDPRVLIGRVARESDASMIVAGARGTGALEVLL
ncbi:MAG: universal stress protein, partial [Ilumatobacteraceae bacterium]